MKHDPLRKILCLALAVLMICALAGCGDVPGLEPFETVERPEIELPEVRGINPSFGSLLEKYGISDVYADDYDYCVTMAGEVEGFLNLIEYYHEDDLITKMKETLYYPDPHDGSDVEGMLSDAFSRFNEYDCCTVTVGLSPRFDAYYVQISYDGLDSLDAMKELAEMGIADDPNALLSLEITKSAREAEGYICKFLD